MKTRNSFLTLVSFAVLLLMVIYMSCSSGDEPEPFDCNTSNLVLELVSTVNPTSCGVNNGSITVAATGGQGPFQFKLDNGAFGSLVTFSNLGGGSFLVTVRDSRGCEKQITGIILTAPAGPSFQASTIEDQTDCSDPNGSITANVVGGTPPFEYRLGTGAFVSSSTFTNLKGGNYTITVTDAAACTISINATVKSNTGVSYLTHIKPILETNCIKAGCHDGNSGIPNWGVLSTVQANAQNIKLRTGNGTMPADQPSGLPQHERDLIACWVDEGAKNN